jgi:hypothetical protein
MAAIQIKNLATSVIYPATGVKFRSLAVPSLAHPVAGTLSYWENPG